MNDRIIGIDLSKGEDMTSHLEMPVSYLMKTYQKLGFDVELSTDMKNYHCYFIRMGRNGHHQIVHVHAETLMEFDSCSKTFSDIANSIIKAESIDKMAQACQSAPKTEGFLHKTPGETVHFPVDPDYLPQTEGRY